MLNVNREEWVLFKMDVGDLGFVLDAENELNSIVHYNRSRNFCII